MEGKIERKYYGHLLDTNFGSGTANYRRLGEDLEELNEEMNPDVELQKNILGEQSVVHRGYEAQSEVTPFYAHRGDPLFDRVFAIANHRLTGDACKTTKVDVLLNEDGTVESAFREDVYVIPTSIGGDTSGMQIPFTVYCAGNRVEGNFDMQTKEFTEVEYTKVTNPDGNPSTLGYYELASGGVYFKSADTEVASGKNYYTRAAKAA